MIFNKNNQIEFFIKKHTEHENGVWSDFVVRSEFGNGNPYAYSSSGSQKQNTDAQFKIKEGFVEIGGFSFFGEDISIWAGLGFLNRSADLLSGEFWKQSSNVGLDIQTKLAGNTGGFAVVIADPDAGSTSPGTDRTTLRSYDFYYYTRDL